MAGSLLEWTSSLDRPDKLVAWNRTVAYRNPATGHRQVGLRCAAD